MKFKKIKKIHENVLIYFVNRVCLVRVCNLESTLPSFPCYKKWKFISLSLISQIKKINIKINAVIEELVKGNSELFNAQNIVIPQNLKFELKKLKLPRKICS